jgi:hypothetical protein
MKRKTDRFLMLGVKFSLQLLVPDVHALDAAANVGVVDQAAAERVVVAAEGEVHGRQEGSGDAEQRRSLWLDFFQRITFSDLSGL